MINRESHFYQKLRYQTGLTLIEIMIAMLLSVILLGGMVQIFVSSKVTYNVQESLSRLQENGRFALNFLIDDIRRAGYLGCVSNINVSTITNTLQSDPPGFNPQEGITGWEANNTGSGDTLNLLATTADITVTTTGWTTNSTTSSVGTTTAQPGSDIVRLWFGGSNPVSINSITPGTAQTNVRTSPTNTIQVNDIILLTDCARATFAQACNVQNTGGGSETKLTFSAGCTPGNDVTAPMNLSIPPGEVVTLNSVMYYIGKSSTDSPPTLYRRTLNAQGQLGTAQPLVPGVESMQLTYGVDSDNNNSANDYVDASAVNDWTQVVSVRVALLVASVNTGLEDTNTQTYQLLGLTVNPPDDQQMRQVFTSTITLRNRTL